MIANSEIVPGIEPKIAENKHDRRIRAIGSSDAVTFDSTMLEDII